MTDKTDCDMKCSGYVNKLKASFGYLQPLVLGNLLKTFCCSFTVPHCSPTPCLSKNVHSLEYWCAIYF